MLIFNRNIFIIVCIHLGMSQNIISQSFEKYKSDTINKTDASNKKQGKWIIFFSNSKQIEQEGFFENDRKTGTWKTYYQPGIIKSEITYKNNQPNGYAKIYYENGKISEEGIWKGTMWVDAYKFYHKNGQIAYEWNFDENGKRTGEQKYYHQNGKLYIKGEWVEGKENGTITEYNENGSIKSEKQFASGQFDVDKSKFYADKKVVVDEIPEDTNATITKVQDEKTNTEITTQAFSGNGFHKLYNVSKQIDREGEFRNGKLMDGKRYYYDGNGKLVKTVIYENGTINKTIKEN